MRGFKFQKSSGKLILGVNTFLMKGTKTFSHAPGFFIVVLFSIILVASLNDHSQMVFDGQKNWKKNVVREKNLVNNEKFS